MKVVDPLRTWIINKEEYARRIHIIGVVAIFSFGLITPITTVAATDGYHIGDFPPDQCYSDAIVFFHGILLPNIIICVIGIILIVITFFYVHRVSMYYICIATDREGFLGWDNTKCYQIIMC